MISLLIPIVTLPILTRALGVDGYGVLMLINTINIFGVIVLDYSSQTFGIREYKVSKEKNKFYYDVQSARLLLLLVYFIFVYIYVCLFVDYVSGSYVIYYVLPYLLGMYLTAQWFHLCNSELLYVSVLSIIARLINLIGILLFVKKPEDLTFSLAICTIPVLVTGFIVNYLRCSKHKLEKFHFSNPIKVFKDGFSIFISDFAPNLYNNIPVIIYASSSSSSQFAFFALATRIVNIIMLVQNIIMKASYPILLDKTIRMRNIILSNVVLSIFLVLLLFVFKNDILTIITGGHNFSSALIIVDILLIGVIFNGVIYSLTYGYLYKMKIDTLLSKVMLRACFLSSLIVLILSYSYDVIGLSLGLTMSRVVIALTLYVLYVKNKNITF